MHTALTRGLLAISVSAMLALAGYGMVLVAEASRQVTIFAPQRQPAARPLPRKGKKQIGMPSPRPVFSEPRNQ